MSLLLNKIDPNDVYEVQYKEDSGDWGNTEHRKLMFSPNFTADKETLGTLIPLSEEGRTLNQAFEVQNIEEKSGFLYLKCKNGSIRVEVGYTGTLEAVEDVFSKYTGMYPPELKEDVLDLLGGS